MGTIVRAAVGLAAGVGLTLWLAAAAMRRSGLRGAPASRFFGRSEWCEEERRFLRSNQAAAAQAHRAGTPPGRPGRGCRIDARQ